MNNPVFVLYTFPDLYVVMGSCGGSITDEEIWPVCWVACLEEAEWYVDRLKKALKGLPKDCTPQQDEENPAYWSEPSKKNIALAKKTMEPLDPNWRGDWN